MPTYTVTDPISGRKVSLTGDSPPTESELNDVFSKLPAISKPAAQTAPAPATPAPIKDTGVPAGGAFSEKGFFSPLGAVGNALYGAGGDLNQRIQNAADITYSDPDKLRAAGRIVGQGADLVGDVFGRGVTALTKLANGATLGLAPVAVNALAKTGAGQAVQKGGAEALAALAKNPIDEAIAKQSPENQDLIQGLTNAAMMALPVGELTNLARGAKAAEASTMGVSGMSAADEAAAMAAARDEIKRASLASANPSPVGAAIKNAANRMENTSIKIMSKEQKQGANPENFGKYGLFGAPEAVHESAKAQISDAASKLRDVLETASADPVNNVNMSDIMLNVRNKMVSDNSMSKAEKRNLLGALKSVGEEIEPPYLNEDKMPVPQNLLEAQLLKRYVGKKGDWLSSPNGGMMIDPAASEKSQVYNSVYDELKNKLENAGGPEVKELNTKMSELIPLERAAGKRVLVASRNHPIDLKTFLGGLATVSSAAAGHYAPAALTVADIASRSPAVAKALYAVSESLDKGASPLVSNLAAAANKLQGGMGGLRRTRFAPRGETVLPVNFGEGQEPVIEPEEAPIVATLGNRQNQPRTLAETYQPLKQEESTGFEGMGDLLTPQEFKAQQKLDISNTDLPPEAFSNYAPNHLMTEEQLNAKAMADEYKRNTPAPGGQGTLLDLANKTKSDLKKQFFGKTKKEVNFASLPADKQKQINDFVNKVNTDPATWNDLYQKGVLDRPFSEYDLHHDDVIRWMNESAPKKSSGGGFFSSLGNERGAVGAENPQIHTDNFKQWFGDWKNKPQEASKVVDEAGKPLVVYHGTGKEFTEFSPEKTNGMIWLTGNKKYSNEFSSDGIAPMALYADVKNPINARSMTGERSLDYWKGKLDNLGIDTKNIDFEKLNWAPDYGKYSFYDLLPHAGNNSLDAGVLSAMKRAGYDGILAPNEINNGIKSTQTIVAFEPNQIKSATGNSGAFSPSVADIRDSAAVPTLAATGALAGGAAAGHYAPAALTVADIASRSPAENPQIHTEQFKQWFGDWKNKPQEASKVVDEHHRPLVVFHGGSTGPTDFSSGTRRGYMGVAYFSDSKDVGLKYAIAGGVRDEQLGTSTVSGYKNKLRESGISRSPQLTRAYLDIKNPATPDDFVGKDVVDTYGKDEVKKWVEEDGRLMEMEEPQYGGYEPSELEDLGYKNIDEYLNDKNNLANYIDEEYGRNDLVLGYDDPSLGHYDPSGAFRLLHLKSKLPDFLEKNGYDGWKYKDFEAGGTTYVPLRATQIKSVTGNSGAFSPQNPDIRGSAAVPTLAATGALAGGAAAGGLALQNRSQQNKPITGNASVDALIKMLSDLQTTNRVAP